MLCEHCIDILVLSQSLVKCISSFYSANNITVSSDLIYTVLCVRCVDTKLLSTNHIHMLLVSFNKWVFQCSQSRMGDMKGCVDRQILGYFDGLWEEIWEWDQG